VKAECLPFSSIPQRSPLFRDFVQHFDRVREFYARPPAFMDWWKDELQHIRCPQPRRQQVAAILERQNRRFGSGTKSMENIQRIRNGAPAILTGQQVALFGGPMFVLLKALTAVLLAEKAGAAPVFWMATEDHDAEEISFVHIPAADHLEKFSISPPHPPNAPVSSIAFTEEIESLLQRLEQQFDGSDVLKLLRETYRPGQTFGEAFGKFYAQVLAEYGVVLLDPSDPELHQIAGPIYQDALMKSHELNQALAQRDGQLEQAGYTPQVKVTPSHTLCFYFQNGSRLPIRHDASSHDGFLVGEERVPRKDLVAEAGKDPSRFSANVLLRPVVQDYLLPTLCYVGGPAEVSYFAQAEVVYRTLLGRVTPVSPRASATLIEPRQAKLLQRYELTATDAFRGPEKLREQVAAKTLPESILRSFDEAGEHLEHAIRLVHAPVEQLDPTLRDAAENAASKMRHQLQALRDKAARAEARKDGELQRHAAELSTLLYPNRNLQEREIGVSYFLLKYGVSLAQQVKNNLNISCLDHQILEIEKN
jgi:bacillithiol synthase